MEDQMKKNMENDMETGIIIALVKGVILGSI